jgi:hypothetical protein
MMNNAPSAYENALGTEEALNPDSTFADDGNPVSTYDLNTHNANSIGDASGGDVHRPFLYYGGKGCITIALHVQSGRRGRRY